MVVILKAELTSPTGNLAYQRARARERLITRLTYSDSGRSVRPADKRKGAPQVSASRANLPTSWRPFGGILGELPQGHPWTVERVLKEAKKRLQGAEITVQGVVHGQPRCTERYFSANIHDEQNQKALLRLFFWRNAKPGLYAELSGAQDGATITAQGRLGVSPPTAGNALQMEVMSATLGDAALSKQEFEEAKRRFTAEAFPAPRLPTVLTHLTVLRPVGTTDTDLLGAERKRYPYTPRMKFESIPGDHAEKIATVLRQITDQWLRDECPSGRAVLLARGGTVEDRSAWSSPVLLQQIVDTHSFGLPVVVAVGHTEHNPLAYQVAALGITHPAQVVTDLNDHNRRVFERLSGAESMVNEALTQASRDLLHRMDRAHDTVFAPLPTLLAERRSSLDQAASTRAAILQNDLSNRRFRLDGDIAQGRKDLQRDFRDLTSSLQAVARDQRALSRDTITRLRTLDNERLSLQDSLRERISVRSDRIEAERRPLLRELLQAVRSKSVALREFDSFFRNMTEGSALIRSPDGAPAVLSVGSQIVIETADDIVLAEILRDLIGGRSASSHEHSQGMEAGNGRQRTD